ncbi:actin-regulating kinase Prk1p [Trichomonascus vanleenenianus]|uniref:serine/threonine protein kinase PRK1 n=1 Tax=Trichomonascus vanleenenianus TaxID=2268995 RepID=UPI003ECAF6AF
MQAPQPPPGAFAPGTKLQVGSHQVAIKSYISAGGFAHVYVVYVSPKEDGTDVACLKRVQVPDKVHLNLLRAEVDAMKRLRGHPNIVRYIDSHASRMPGHTGEYEVLLLMEYCSNNGLIDFMNSRLKDQLKEHEILKIMYDITYGLACMHYLDPPLIHRDLKIENVLIAGDGTFKLCDFGSSSPVLRPPRNSTEFHILDDDIQRHTTAQYRSPEMVDIYRGFPIDEKSDIWALGVFLYKLCYYTTPFEKEGQLAILHARFSFPNYPQYSDRLKRVATACLREDPRNRPTVYQVFKEVCLMRGVTVPIPDIYSAAKQQLQQLQQLQAPQLVPPVNATNGNTTYDSASSSASSIVVPSSQGGGGLAVPSPKRPIPEVTPMYRGRPKVPQHAARAVGSLSPSPVPVSAAQPSTSTVALNDINSPVAADARATAVFSDPFALLDGQKKSKSKSGSPVENEVPNFEDASLRFPTVEELARSLEQQSFQFGAGDSVDYFASEPELEKSATLDRDFAPSLAKSQPDIRQQTKSQPEIRDQTQSEPEISHHHAEEEEDDLFASPPPSSYTKPGHGRRISAFVGQYEAQLRTQEPSLFDEPTEEPSQVTTVITTTVTAASSPDLENESIDPKHVRPFTNHKSSPNLARSDARPPRINPAKPRPASMYATKQTLLDLSDSTSDEEEEQEESRRVGRTASAQPAEASLIDTSPEEEDRQQLRTILTGVSQRSNTVVLEDERNHIDSNVDFLKSLETTEVYKRAGGRRSSSMHRQPSAHSAASSVLSEKVAVVSNGTKPSPPRDIPSGNNNSTGRNNGGSWKLRRSGSYSQRASQEEPAPPKHHSKRSSISSIKGIINDAFKKQPTTTNNSIESASPSMGPPPVMPPRTSSRQGYRFSHSAENFFEGKAATSPERREPSNGFKRANTTNSAPLKRPNAIQARVQSYLNRTDTPPPQRTAYGYGKYTGERPTSPLAPSPEIIPQQQAVSPTLSHSRHSSIDSGRRPPVPTKPKHLQSPKRKVTGDREDDDWESKFNQKYPSLG